MCGGIGCNHCDRGFFSLTTCPNRYVGGRLINDINIAASCEDGVLPVAGGLLDQPAYFYELSRTMKNEVHSIELEQSKRR